MSEPYLGEIRIFTFLYAPKNWAFCNGQLLAINQSQALFSLLGTTYGGNGTTNFGLPNLQGRLPLHFGNGFALGQKAGEESHVLSIQEMPTHVHTATATSDVATTNVATGNRLATVNNGYTTASNVVTMAAGTVSSIGGNQAHSNMQPYLILSFCIALTGIFPSQN